MNSLNGLSIFIQVVEQHSFSAAAKKLHTSKANISRQISRLEARLGVQLFQRSTRKVSLTEVGHTFYLDISQHLQELERIQRTVMDLQDVPHGTLRISTAGLFGETKVAAAATLYMQRYPEVKIELNFSDRLIDLIGENYDLAIRSGVLEDSSLIARRVSSRRLVLCASLNYINKYGSPKNLSDLRQHQCLQGSTPTWHFKDKSYKLHSNNASDRWKSNNGHAILQACIYGLGIAQLPEYYVREAVQKGQLKILLEDHEPEDNGIWAIYPSNRNLPSKVRLFIELLIELNEIE